MTGMSNIYSYERGSNFVTRIKFSNGHSMSISKPKKSSSKKLRPKYNYKLLSTAILKAKTPNAASVAAIKARKKLAELLCSSDEKSDPDLRAAIIHARKMVLIAKRKKNHLEQEEMAERGRAIPGAENEKTEEALEEKFGGSSSGKDEEQALKEESARLAEEMEQMEREMTEDMLKELSELSEEFMKNEEKMLEEEMPVIEGFEDVSDMSADDVKELKRKHRSDELRDITKADMDFLKAKFYRLQQEKAIAGMKGISPGIDSGSSSDIATGIIDISIDASMDMEFASADVGTVVDTTV